MTKSLNLMPLKLLDLANLVKRWNFGSPGSSKGRKRSFDYEEFKKFTDYCGAEVLTDMAYFSGFVGVGVHPNSIPHANVVIATTFKNLYGFGWGLVLSKETDLQRKLDNAVFLCIQGFWALMHLRARMSGWGPATRLRRICITGRSQCLYPGKNSFWKEDWSHHCRHRHSSDRIAAFSVDLTTGLGCPWSLRFYLQKQFSTSLRLSAKLLSARHCGLKALIFRSDSWWSCLSIRSLPWFTDD